MARRVGQNQRQHSGTAAIVPIATAKEATQARLGRVAIDLAKTLVTCPNIHAVAVMIIGVVRRLQAPFIIGAVVLLIHGISTFAPQIVAVYESAEWWLWAAIGGAIIIFLSATYKKRMRDLKNVRIVDLR